MSFIPTQRSSGHRARKRFGQNFLVNDNVISGIIRAVQAQEQDNLIEIGPGLGVLTERFAQTKAKLTAIELDRDLADRISERFASNSNFRLLCQDALKVDFSTVYDIDSRLRIIGNLPYNISTPLIFHLLKYAEQIDDMHFMLQKEVVDRMAAAPSTKDFGRLSVMVQYRCTVESIIDVPPQSFDPPPKVDSAVVRLIPKKPELKANSIPWFERIVRNAFNQRRKTLRNTLRNELTPEQIEQLGINPSLRPENLSVTEYVKLANYAHEISND